MKLRVAAKVLAALLAISGCTEIQPQEIHSRPLQSAGGPFMPAEVALDPAMNPLRITVSAKVAEANRASHPNQRVNYQLSLYRDGRLQKRWTAMLSAQGEDGKARADASFTIEPVEVAAAGTYVLVLLRPGGDIAPLFADHHLRLWRNAAPAK